MKEGKDFSPRRGKVIATREDGNTNTITANQGIEQSIVIQKVRHNFTTVKINETGTIQAGGMSGSDKIPNIVIGASRGRGETNIQTLEINDNNQSNTLTGVEKDNLVVLLDEYSIRRLTEIECERLQGFPDNWTLMGLYPVIKISQKKFNKLSNDEKIKHIESGTTIVKKISRTQRYKMCGNAVTKDIVEAIAIKLLNG